MNSTVYTFMIPLEYLESVNSRLTYQRGNVRLTDSARAEKREVYKYLSEHYSSKLLSHLKNKYLSVTMFYFLKSSFNSRDVSNLGKGSQDSLFAYFGLNDKWILNQTISKRRIGDSKYEYLYVKISELPETKLDFELQDILRVQSSKEDD